MRTSAVVGFKGDCEAAFKFYEQHLGGQPWPISVMPTVREGPHQLPPE